MHDPAGARVAAGEAGAQLDPVTGLRPVEVQDPVFEHRPADPGVGVAVGRPRPGLAEQPSHPVRDAADEDLGPHPSEDVAFGRADDAEADPLEAERVGAFQGGGGYDRREVDAARRGEARNLDRQCTRRLAQALGPGEGAQLARGGVIDDQLEGRGRLAIEVADDQQQTRVALAELHDPAGHVQRRAGLCLAQKADVLLTHDQRRFAVAGEGARHAQSRREAGQSLLGLGDPEADVHVPHLVAFPGVDAAAPDLDALLGHLHAPPTLEKRREP